MEALKLIEVGDEIGIIFPDELCARLRLELGDEVHLKPTARGFSLHANHSDAKLFFEKPRDSTKLHQDTSP